jgi:hypothetical protein
MRPPEWTQASQNYLSEEITRLQVYIERRNRREPVTFDFPVLDPTQPLLALQQLTYTFDLTPYEWALFMLCAAWELNTTIALQCNQFLQQTISAPSIDLALSLFGCDSNPFDPRSPLFHRSLGASLHPRL